MCNVFTSSIMCYGWIIIGFAATVFLTVVGIGLFNILKRKAAVTETERLHAQSLWRTTVMLTRFDGIARTEEFDQLLRELPMIIGYPDPISGEHRDAWLLRLNRWFQGE